MSKLSIQESPRCPQRRAAGMTLIELMVALAIGSFLLIGAVTVYTQTRTTFRINQTVSRLQENGRFVMDSVVPDLRMAHYWGLTTRSTRIAGRATPLDPMSALDFAGDCGTNWAIDLEHDVAATNNGYTWLCTPYGGAASPTSDTLVVRRAAEDAITGALSAGTLYIQSARVVTGQLFNGPPAPTLTGPSETHLLVVDGYYVSQTSTLSTPGNTIPALYVQTLAPGPQIEDREVLPGVEDMQVQFGVDTDAPNAATRGSVNRYVNPGDPILDPTSGSYNPDAVVLAVRVWFRIRALRRENGYSNTTHYVYADQDWTAPGDPYRRTLVSKTVYLRNARPAS